MTSADFCRSFPTSRDAGSRFTDTATDLPGYFAPTSTLIPATYTPTLSVQLRDFKEVCLLIQCCRLICSFCSSGQCFAFGFLQPTPRDVNLAVPLVVPTAGPTGDLNPRVGAPCQAHRHNTLSTACLGKWRIYQGSSKASSTLDQAAVNASSSPPSSKNQCVIKSGSPSSLVDAG